MSDNLIRGLAEFIEEVKNTDDINEYRALRDSRLGALGKDCGAEESKLVNALSSLTDIYFGYKVRILESEKDVKLSETEQQENALVQKLLDENLFSYHFQPIVRADSGEIYAYEALMRAQGMKGISPFHILKYAELTNRLADVESLTFLNVLRYLEENKASFGEKTVFINSMPKIKASESDAKAIDKLFLERSVKVVVEMTETAEFDDNDIKEIRERYHRFGVPIAIDDFGTGYSNIHNLLRYAPNIVKIDRSLISGVDSNANKKRVVREVVDFCRENGIMSLAEGVETSEELRTVILMGIDLIQGFYTAMPSPEILKEIPFKIRAEIKGHTEERENGRRLHRYIAEKDERVSLEYLTKDEFTCIGIGSKCFGSTVTVAGAPRFKSNIHITTADNFRGTIVLENACLSNFTERPCIEIGENNEVTVVLVGSNRLENSGIRVPESSSLTVEGKGDLDIKLGSADYYGIGNDLSSHHGKLIFDQDGTVYVTSESHAGVCIGSGLGGIITFNRGRYVLKTAGSSSTCIGAEMGDTSVSIIGCDIECSSSVAYCTLIGSISGDADVKAMNSSVKLSANSQLAVGIGTLRGERSRVRIESMSLSTEIRADDLTAFGSLHGSSDIFVERTSVRTYVNGSHALVFGGYGGDTKLTAADSDFSAEVCSELTSMMVPDISGAVLKGGRYKVLFNGEKHDTFI